MKRKMTTSHALKRRMIAEEEQDIAAADALMTEIADLEIQAIKTATRYEERIAALKRLMIEERDATRSLLDARHEDLAGRVDRMFGAKPPRSRTCASGKYGKHLVAKVKITDPGKVIAYAKRRRLPLFAVTERVDLPAVRAAISAGRKVPGAVLTVQDRVFHVVDRRLVEQAVAARHSQRVPRVRRNGRAAA